LHLTNGIIDEHTHIGLSRGVNEAGSNSSAEVRMSDVINPDDVNFYRQIVGGVTQHNNYTVLQIQLADSLPL
jgi:imidazolonepropionase-like amidohydrolase